MAWAIAPLVAAAEPPKIESAAPANGVFVTYGYHSTVLELKDGKFRYWFSSDVKIAGDETKYPLEGSYTTDGDTITLKHEKIHPPQVEWTARKVDGVLTFWRSDALKIQAEGKLELYSLGKANFLRIGSGSVIVPTTKTAEEAWKTPQTALLTEAEGKVLEERRQRSEEKSKPAEREKE